ncbi:MAG TPA: class I SAM-dependent methyltransferase [Bacillota bacterium]|nr:methyltransferase domain-containing protein [Bacillota bacterium]HPQ01734.1 class I SAM-dependent methyltransferase [Bacillota bacterium]
MDVRRDNGCVCRVREFYESNVEMEWVRLARHRTEFALTARAMEEFLQPASTVLDCGSGPGRYSLLLASRGHKVTLLDISEESLRFAKARAEEQGVRFEECVSASAVDMSMFEDGSFDVVLLMGPLYHLLDPSDRVTCLTEARRVLRCDGLVFATFLVRYAALRDVAKYDPEWLADYPDDANRILKDGIYTFEGRDNPPFTDFWSVHPTEAAAIMEKAGFETQILLAQEGLVSMIDEKVNLLQGEAWEAWVDLNYRCASDPTIHGAAEHLLYVGRRT